MKTILAALLLTLLPVAAHSEETVDPGFNSVGICLDEPGCGGAPVVDEPITKRYCMDFRKAKSWWSDKTKTCFEL